MRIGARKLAAAVAGLAAGSVFLWLALRSVSWAETEALVTSLDARGVWAALGLYWMGLGLRVVRWRCLLSSLGAAPWRGVTETLLVGYAINNLLPARLGEFARAVYARRRLHLGRTRVFGTIVIERLLDLCAILVCLAGGLLVIRAAESGPGTPGFDLVALNAGIVLGLAVLAIAAVRGLSLRSLALPERLQTLLGDFAAGLRSLNRRSFVLAAASTAGIWACEVGALTLIFLAVGVPLSAGQSLLVMGAASLSTLVPTAPGYLGSYQLVAVLAMKIFEYSPSAGVVATAAIQIVLFGSVTVAGLAILCIRALNRAIGKAAGEAQSDSENGVKSVSRS